MASSSRNSSGTMTTTSINNQLLQNSISDQEVMDDRKRKRMISNRESARRSRMRKQKHLDDLVSQVDQLKKENIQISTNMNITTQHYLNVEAENSVLRAQMSELTQRLESLNEIINYMNTINGSVNGGGGIVGNVVGGGIFDTSNYHNITGGGGADVGGDSLMSPWNLGCFNQPIMASADLFQYEY